MHHWLTDSTPRPWDQRFPGAPQLIDRVTFTLKPAAVRSTLDTSPAAAWRQELAAISALVKLPKPITDRVAELAASQGAKLPPFPDNLPPLPTLEAEWRTMKAAEKDQATRAAASRLQRTLYTEAGNVFTALAAHLDKNPDTLQAVRHAAHNMRTRAYGTLKWSTPAQASPKHITAGDPVWCIPNLAEWVTDGLPKIDPTNAATYNGPALLTPADVIANVQQLGVTVTVEERAA